MVESVTTVGGGPQEDTLLRAHPDLESLLIVVIIGFTHRIAEPVQALTISVGPAPLYKDFRDALMVGLKTRDGELVALLMLLDNISHHL